MVAMGSLPANAPQMRDRGEKRREEKREMMFAGFTAFTWFHTILSLMAIIAGFVVVRELFASQTWEG